MMRFLLIGSLLALSGCLFQQVTLPLDADFDNTPVMGASEEGDIKHFAYSVVNFAWDSAGVGDVAKKESRFDTVYYVDVEVFRVLGIWNQYYVHVYGK